MYNYIYSKNNPYNRNVMIIVLLLTVVVVRISWQAPPPVSLVSDGPLVVNVSKSKRKSHTASISKSEFCLC